LRCTDGGRRAEYHRGQCDRRWPGLAAQLDPATAAGMETLTRINSMLTWIKVKIAVLCLR